MKMLKTIVRDLKNKYGDAYCNVEYYNKISFDEKYLCQKFCKLSEINEHTFGSHFRDKFEYDDGTLNDLGMVLITEVLY